LLSGLLLGLAGCLGTTSPSLTKMPLPSATAIHATEAPPSPTPIPRSATVKSVTGVVEIRASAEATFAPATAGQQMLTGDELKTGSDGQAVMVLDDGTGIVVAADSSFSLSTLEGTHDNPITRFFLNLGQVFTIGPSDFNPDAVYEIETPRGVATIRGTMLGVRFDLETGGQFNCLIGQCAVALEDIQVDLPAGTQVSVNDQGISAVTDMDSTQILEWSQALQAAEGAGVNTSGEIGSDCTCSGTTLNCSDGTSIAGFPTCIQGSACECESDTLTCGDSTTTDSPVCQAGASGCVCSGPNLLCSGNQVFYNVSACTGGALCLCNGVDLQCDNGTVYPGDPSCAPATDCQCYEGVLMCSNGSMYFNAATCPSNLPCTCQGTTFVCVQDGETVSIPDYPLCGGTGGFAGTCICADGTLYCSDGRIVPGDPSCAGTIVVPDVVEPQTGQPQ